MFATRQKQHKKYANSVYSKQAIDTAFKKLTDSEVLKVCPSPPNTPCEAVTFSNLQCQQAAMYMAGKWIRLSGLNTNHYSQYLLLISSLIIITIVFIITGMYIYLLIQCTILVW